MTRNHRSLTLLPLLRLHRRLGSHRQLGRAAVATLAATGIILGAAAAPLAVAAPASAATTTPVAASDIIAQAVDQAQKQGAARDYTAPVSKPRWKVLFVGFTDVSYTDGSPRQKMDTNDRTYLQNVVKQFVDVLDKKIGVQIVPTLKWHDTPFTTSNAAKRIDVQDSTAIITKLAAAGEYDSIIVASTGNYGGGTFSKWHEPRSQESTYTYISLAPSNGRADYPALPADTDRSTTIALHEFAHVLSVSEQGFPYPDLHNAGSYGYSADRNTEWTPFYLDYLSGKVKVNGVPQGTYPKMWPISPRFLRAPGMATVRYQDASGRQLAPDATAFGVGGDPYSVTAPPISGYRSIALGAGSAPAAGQFVSGTKTAITFVYSSGPTAVTFLGGQTWDLTQAKVVAPGNIYFNSYTYRAAAPISGFTYTDQIVGIDGARRCDSILGTALNWDASGKATVRVNGNTYSATKKSDTLVEIAVALGTPSTTFEVQDVGYGNTAPIGRVQQTYDLLDITPQATGAKEGTTTEPHGFTTLTWGDYRTKVSFLGGETQDFRIPVAKKAGEVFSYRYGYRAAFPISSFSYVDRISAVSGVKFAGSLDGQPLTWSGNFALGTWAGNEVLFTKKSDSLVHIEMTLKTPSTTFAVPGMDYVNTAPAAKADRTVEIVSVVPQVTGKPEKLTRAPKGTTAVTWTDPTVTFTDGRTTDITESTSVAPGKIYWSGVTYRTAFPVIGYTYTDQIVSISGARRCDSLSGVALNWNASGTATVVKDGNTYTVVKKSDTFVEVSVRLGTPDRVINVRDVGYGNVAPVGWVTQTHDLLDITPQATAVPVAVTSEPHKTRTLQWGGWIG